MPYQRLLMLHHIHWLWDNFEGIPCSIQVGSFQRDTLQHTSVLYMLFDLFHQRGKKNLPSADELIAFIILVIAYQETWSSVFPIFIIVIFSFISETIVNHVLRDNMIM